MKVAVAKYHGVSKYILIVILIDCYQVYCSPDIVNRKMVMVHAHTIGS